MTMPVEPGVISRPPVTSTGLLNADSWSLSSSRRTLDSSASLDLRSGGATRTHFGNFKPTSVCVTRPRSLGSDSSREPEARCCHITIFQPPPKPQRRSPTARHCRLTTISCIPQNSASPLPIFRSGSHRCLWSTKCRSPARSSV